MTRTLILAFSLRADFRGSKDRIVLHGNKPQTGRPAGFSPKTFEATTRGPLELAQQRKILRRFAKILLPSKRPFIELATRAPQAIQSKPDFHF